LFNVLKSKILFNTKKIIFTLQKALTTYVIYRERLKYAKIALTALVIYVRNIVKNTAKP
jgi:hypothetical protein